MNPIEHINTIIQERRSVFPINYVDKEIPKSFIEQLLRNADRAPTHKLTEPWRFKVISGAKKAELGEFLAQKYQQICPDNSYKERKYSSLLNKPNQAQVVISVNFQRDLMEQVPEWEEIASVAMAVQNMYLTCTAYDIGCYWSSPSLIKYMSEFYTMQEGERCLGLFYIGHYKNKMPLSKRRPLEEKVEWL